MSVPALFLDRDGVINVDYGYVYRADNFHFIEGIFDVCRSARSAGYKIFVITNQAGIGRGYYTEDDFAAITSWMCERFEAEDCQIEKVYFCPDHPVHGLGAYRKDSPQRKPGPGMLLDAGRDFDIDFESSVMVGDKESDMEAAYAAGVGRRILLATPLSPYRGKATTVISSIAQVADLLTTGS